MGSESSIFMTRAVIFSLLFHAVVFIVMSFFLTLKPQIEVFSPIKVYFSVSETESSAPEPSAPDSLGTVSEILTTEEKPVAVLEQAAAVEAAIEDDIPPPELPVTLPSPAASSDVSYSQPQAEQSQEIQVVKPAASDARETSVQAPGDSSGVEDSEVLDSSVVSKAENPGSSKQADLQWTGGAAFLQFVPEPDFKLPFNAILPDTIIISFEVQSDGTVKSIKIRPPGSGHVAVDQQIRSYVNSFIFEPFNPGEDDKSGLLRLSLRKRGADGT